MGESKRNGTTYTVVQHLTARERHMAIGIIPLVDYAFKKLLGSEHNTRITIHFLNSVLTGQPRITVIRFLNPIRLRQNADGKLCILDILAIDEHGRQLNIEVQILMPAGMAQRLTYYTCRAYVEQMKEGQDYSDLRPSICICVLAGQMFAAPPVLHLDFRLREKSHTLTLTDDLQIHLLQLNHLHVTEETLYDASALERWAWFLCHADQLTSEQIHELFPDEVFTEAAGVLEMIAQSPEELIEYNARLKAQRDDRARLLYAQQQGIEQGREEGREQGREEGREQGREEGREQGREEGREQGREEGRVKGEILLLQKLLLLPVWTDSQFAACTMQELSQISADLQHRFIAGRS
ncbi:MAG: Rpn family recombination-promoting nuclease/putative transposase [Planctomyces sp.]